MNSKLKMYSKKLLDTGKRNRLINFKETVSSTVEFYIDDLNSFLDDYLSFKSFEIAKLFTNLDEFVSSNDLLEDTLSEENQKINDNVVDALGEFILKKDRYKKEEIDAIKKRFKENKNTLYLYSSSLYSTLWHEMNLLKSKSRVLMEETGNNPLYLCIGFLSYQEDNQNYLAPLTLIPSKISQKNLNSPFFLQSLDDDYKLNDNLIHKLKMDYNLDLRRDDLSILEYLDFVREKIKGFNMEVIESTWLGLFSFGKIMMHKDLYENEKLIESSPSASIFLNSKYNGNIKVENNLNQFKVLDADSSQELAISYALSNISFVLQGPPGTGKSQTITNMIASLIGNNKRVLFVCEKKAALDVVYNNLKKASLDIFAIPLYDTKISKKEIVKELHQNLINVIAKKIDLNDKAVEAILNLEILEHRFKDLLTETNKNEKFLEYYFNSDVSLNFKIDNVLKLKEEELNKIVEEIKNISNLSLTFDDAISNNPFYGFNRIKMNLDEKKSFYNELNKVLPNLYELDEFFNSLNEICPNLNINLKNSKGIFKLLELLKDRPSFNKKYYQIEDIDTYLENLIFLKKSYSSIKKIKDELSNVFSDKIYDEDIKKYLNELKKYDSKIKRLFSYKHLHEEISKFLKKNISLDYEDEVKYLEEALKYQNTYKKIFEIEPKFYKDFDDIYFGSKTDFNKLSMILSHLSSVLELKVEYQSNFDEILLINNSNLDLLLKNKLSFYRNIFDTNYDLMLNISDYFNQFMDLSFNKMVEKIENLINHYDYLNPYMNYLKSFNKLSKIAHDFIIEAESLKINPKDYLNAFLKRYATLYLDEYLSDFDLSKIKEDYLNFKKLDKDLIDISRIKLNNIITSNFPKIDGIMSNNAEVRALILEVNKKRKLKSIRNLLSEIPNMLKVMKPIFLMSPLSVATYLDPKVYHFDTVIFDEASQITMENAIGSIYRADQVIIVGDHEQLPPTSFFDMDRIQEEDEDLDLYESVLDEARTLLPSIMLKWHYRSQDESLIYYSNKMIYHDLQTFPSSKPFDELGLHFIYVPNGIYIHGSRINIVEAKRVAFEVLNIAKNHKDLSLGVVTFNMAQQNLISNLIKKEIGKDKSLEEFFKEDKENPFFVKNLETVQGDERDIIILSTTFGYDETGKLSLNFGPINQEGGYRRLNVAISRSKMKMILVSSLDSNDIDLKKTKNNGVLMLRGFLEYAKSKNEFVLPPNLNKSESIIMDLKNHLESLGYHTYLNYGLSSFKIDIAVFNQDTKEFIMAILFDLKEYNKLLNFSCRLRLIDNQLLNRNWKVYHVFSLDYFYNKDFIIKDILKEMNESNLLDSVTNNYIKEENQNSIHIESLFDSYPNKEELIHYAKSKGYSIYEALSYFLNRLSPIKIEDLKNMILPLFSLNKMTEDLNSKIDSTLDEILNEKNYFKIIGFITSFNDSMMGYRFRKCESFNLKREIDSIYIEELESGFITLISYVKNISKNILFENFNILLGYAKNSKLTNQKFNRVLNILVEKDLIKIENEIIIYKDIKNI